MKPLKIMTWNIEHFNGRGGIKKSTKAQRKNRVKRVIEYILLEDPDVFGISEVTSSEVYEIFTRHLPGYSFHITDGDQSMEILIGVKDGFTSFFRQKDQFKRNNIYLRPGALLTLRIEDIHIPILFTHLKSASTPEGFGLRDAMYEQIFKLKKKLDEAQKTLPGNQDKSNFIVLGDMNTMGLDYYYSPDLVTIDKEIEVLTEKLDRRGMKALKKSHPHTFYNGSNSKYPPSNLDHVFAAEHLTFDVISGGDVNVRVAGWAEKSSTSDKNRWVEQYSDHAPLIFTLLG